jgi:hypothetical protein
MRSFGREYAMRSRDRNLIDQIERDVSQEDVPVAAALRKVILLGGRVGSTELRDWASRELKGYVGSTTTTFRTTG